METTLLNLNKYLIEIKLKTLNFEVLETQIPLSNGSWRLNQPKFENCYSEDYSIDIIIKRNINQNYSKNSNKFYNTLKETYIIENTILDTNNLVQVTQNLNHINKDIYRLSLKKINEEYIYYLANPYDIFIVNDDNNENITFKIQINKELIQKGNLEPKLLLLFERI